MNNDPPVKFDLDLEHRILEAMSMKLAARPRSAFEELGECAKLLDSDLYRLTKQPDPDERLLGQTTRFTSPLGNVIVTLVVQQRAIDGKPRLCAFVQFSDGRIIAESDNATREWLDSVLP